MHVAGVNSNTTLVKVKFIGLNYQKTFFNHSNTTLVKVKLKTKCAIIGKKCYSNTTLVKVKSGIKNNEAENFLEFKYNTC